MIKRFTLFLCVAHIVLLSLAQMQPEVGLKTGQIIRPTLLKLKNPFLGKSYLLLDEKQKIQLNEVDYYQTTSKFFLVRSFDHTGTIPLERVEAGRVAMYEYMRLESRSAPMGPDGIVGAPNTGTRVYHYYSKDGGELQYLSVKNLMKDLGDYPASLQKVRKARNKKFISMGIRLVGGAMLLAGIIQMVNEVDQGESPSDKNPSLNTPIFIGLGIMVVPLLIDSSQGENLRDAIRLYNAHYRE